MAETDNNIRINATIEIPATTLQTIVAVVKKKVPPDEKGIYHVDTADAVNRLISEFLCRNGFDDFVTDPDNYNVLFGKSE